MYPKNIKMTASDLMHGQARETQPSEAKALQGGNFGGQSSNLNKDLDERIA